MKKIEEILDGVKTMGIAGHIRPDGDCVGSCMALYLYIKKCYPDIEVDIYMEPAKPVFEYIVDFGEIKNEAIEEKEYDLFVACDTSTKDRIGVAGKYFDNAKKTVCIDHHISNVGYAQINHICANVGSASEVLYGLLDPEKIDLNIAEAIYTGIVHDTGVFQYSSTTADTMQIAGELLKKGVRFNKIIEESFYQKTYIQNQVMGRVLAESIVLQEINCIIGYLKRKDMLFYGVNGNDLDGIVSQLRLTKGIEVALFLYEFDTQTFKVSLRSNGKVDVNKVASVFGGGGHTLAAGCSMNGSMYDVINNISAEIEKQLQ